VITLASRRLTLRPRHLWLVPGLALSLLANAQASDHGFGIAPLLVFGILPHVPALGGSRAVPLFNAFHHAALPGALLVLASAAILPVFWLVASLAWLSHIVVGWAVGDGARTVDEPRTATAHG
jgi:hypothetical protein